MRASLLFVICVLVLSGCGYRGPLYLPKPKPEAQKPAPAPAPALKKEEDAQ